MTKKKQLIIYLTFMIIFIISLCFANSVIEMTQNIENRLSTINVDSIQSNQTPIVYIEDVSYRGGITEDFLVSGWAFCETQFDNSAKQINVVLQKTNSSKAFISYSNAQYRDDVYGAFRNQKNIYGVMNGLVSRFSTYKMPLGVYELFINVVENDNDYGIVSTNRFFKKTAFDFYEVDSEGNDIIQSEQDQETAFKSELSDISIEPDDPSGVAWIDSVVFNEQESSLLISGWGSYSAETNNTQKVFVGVTNSDGYTSYYTTKVVNRQDVATAYNDSSYAKCGFSADISIPDVSDGFTISVVTEISDKYYLLSAKGQVEYAAEDKHLEISVEEGVHGRAYVDRIDYNDETMEIYGWATFSAETNLEQEIYVVITDSDGNVNYYPTESKERRDVADSFGDESYLNCGYYTIIPSALNTEKSYTIDVIARISEKYYLLDTHGYNEIPLTIQEELTAKETVSAEDTFDAVDNAA